MRSTQRFPSRSTFHEARLHLVMILIPKFLSLIFMNMQSDFFATIPARQHDLSHIVNILLCASVVRK